MDQNLSATTEPVRRELRGFLHAFTILSQRKIFRGEFVEKDVTHLTFMGPCIVIYFYSKTN